MCTLHVFISIRVAMYLTVVIGTEWIAMYINCPTLIFRFSLTHSILQKFTYIIIRGIGSEVASKSLVIIESCK